MGYTINSVVPKGDDGISISVKFSGGQEGSVIVPPDSTEAVVLAKLDEIEAAYPTIAQMKSDLPGELQDLVGYVKA